MILKIKKRIYMPPLRAATFQDRREKRQKTRKAAEDAAIREYMEILKAKVKGDK